MYCNIYFPVEGKARNVLFKVRPGDNLVDIRAIKDIPRQTPQCPLLNLGIILVFSDGEVPDDHSGMDKVPTLMNQCLNRLYSMGAPIPPLIIDTYKFQDRNVLGKYAVDCKNLKPRLLSRFGKLL